MQCNINPDVQYYELYESEFSYSFLLIQRDKNQISILRMRIEANDLELYQNRYIQGIPFKVRYKFSDNFTLVF